MNIINLNHITRKKLEVLLNVLFPEYYTKIKYNQLIKFKKSKWSFGSYRIISIMELLLTDIPERLLAKSTSSNQFIELKRKLSHDNIFEIMMQSRDYSSNIDIIDYLYSQFEILTNSVREKEVIVATEESTILVGSFMDISKVSRELVKKMERPRINSVAKKHIQFISKIKNKILSIDINLPKIPTIRVVVN